MMREGFYKVINRDLYIRSHEVNATFLRRHGNVFELNALGSHVNAPQGAVLLLPHELKYFEYLGKTMPKKVLRKRTPKAGEVWMGFNYKGQEVFYNILEVCDGRVEYELIRPYLKSSRVVRACGLSRFINNTICSYKGIKQYRVFSH